MPTNMLEIKQLFADWYLLALDNSLFVAVLVVVVWILAAVIYNFKILLLAKKLKAGEQAYIEIENKLVTTEQQVKQLEDKIALDVEQTEKGKQLVVELQDKLTQRKQIIISNIKSIAQKFDLSEQLAGSDKEMKEEFVWQQQDNIIQQLTDRLGVAQQQITQSGEKDALISHLQNSLDAHTEQFAQLGKAIAEQKQSQLQQQKELQQQLSESLEQLQQSVAQNMDIAQNQLQPPIENPQETNIPEETVLQSEPKPEALLEQKIVGFSELENAITENAEAVEALPEVIETIEPAITQESVIEQEQKDEQLVELESVSPIRQDTNVHDLLNLAEPAFSTLTENELNQQEFGAETDVKTSVKPKQAIAGKFKNLLGKVKKTAAKEKPEQKIESLAAEDFKLPDPEKSAIKASDVDSKKEGVGKFKSLLGKVKKPKITSEPEQKSEVFESVDLKTPATQEVQLEQKIETFTSEEYKAPKEEEVHVEPDYGASKFKVPGVFKKLLGKG